ncbi:MAG: Gfo/Idh/MocA family oxidoreductase [Ignavibacteriaceae bacterium]
MKKQSKIKKIKWGAAGCGRFTEFSFIPALEFLRKSTINSVYSGTAARAKQVADKYGIPRHFDNYDEFLKSDINAVYIGSINSNHYEQVVKAAEAGKNILCEKPLAMTSAQAEEMVKVCEKNNVHLAVNYVHRFHPLIIKAKEILDSQMLGKLTSINLNFNIDIPPTNNFRFDPKLSGGGALRDLGTHMIDLMRFFGGEIENINGVIDNVVYKSDVEDFSAAILKFKNSGYGTFCVSFSNKKGFNRIEILGHKGGVSIDNLIGKRNVSSKLTILIDGEAKKAFRKRGNKVVYLLRSIQNSFLKNEKPRVTGFDGYVNLKLMEELESKCQR